MALIKCPHCGANISDKAHRCPKCGNTLQFSDKVEIIEQHNNNSNNDYTTSKSHADLPSFEEENNRGKVYLTWVLIGVVVLIGLGLWFLLSNRPTKQLDDPKALLLDEYTEVPLDTTVITTEIDTMGCVGVAAEVVSTSESAELSDEEDDIRLYTDEPPSVQGTFKLTGKVDGKHDIQIWLTIKGNKIHGKYCYNSTLKRYGDTPSSYIQFEGNITPADFFRIKATSSSSSEATYWDGDFKDNHLYAERTLDTGEVRTMEAYVDK